jgi:uncharacterized protein YraI
MQRPVRRSRSKSVYVTVALCLMLIASLLIGLPALADPGSTATVVNTDGDGLNLRESPSTGAAILTGMPEGASVEVLETGISGDGLVWMNVAYDGMTGFAAADYLSVADDGSSGGPAPEPAPSGGVMLGTWATVSGTGGDGVNVREGPGTDNAILTGAGEGASVWVLDGPVVDWGGGAWYQVDADNVIGWVSGLYLAGSGVGGGEPDPPVIPEIPPTDAVGEAILAEAFSHMGVPYLWAGTTPAGFDCSGFTYYVMNEVLERRFPRALYRQIRQGDFIPADELLPGDLVFFENTYTEGLSHVGFYIGNGQFINAGGGVDAVGIDYVFDGYWGERYLGARRVR